MKMLMFFLLVVALLISAESQTRDDVAVSKRLEIRNGIRSYQNRSYELRGRIIYIDSTIHDNDFEYRNIADPYGTLQNCFIIFAGSSNPTEEDSNVIAVYKDNQLIWLSETIFQAETGRLLGTKDLNNDGMVDLITAWSVFASPNFELLTIYSWDGTRGLRITSEENGLDGNAGSFEITDLNGDGVYEITATTLDEDGRGVKIVYSWNGSEFGNWVDSPAYDSQSFSAANNLSVTLRAEVQKINNRRRFTYAIRNDEMSKQTIKDVFFDHRTSLKDTDFDRIKGWSFGALANMHMLYFTALESSYEVPPGKRIDHLSFSTTVALPIISSFYVQAPHLKPRIKNLADLPAATTERAKNILTNSFAIFSIGPGDPPEPFFALAFLDTLISYKHQALDLGWIKDKGIANSLDQKLDAAKAQLEKKNNKAAKNILEAFINEVEALHKDGGRAQKDKHLTSEAYALLKFNAEYLVSKL